jgi:predicted RNA methylase
MNRPGQEESARRFDPSPALSFGNHPMTFTDPSTAAHAAASPLAHTALRAGALITAARSLLPALEAGTTITSPMLRAAMIAAFGGSDAEGHWLWKDAYDSCEIAQILFLRAFAPALRQASPRARLTMLQRIAALLPTHTRRSAESQALQQLSTPLPIAHVAACAAALTPHDTLLEPSAGTGLLAIHAELAGARLILNELSDHRSGVLRRIFPDAPVSQHDAARIHDHLAAPLRPTVILMNPPFSAGAHVEGRVADAALRHIASALARLAPGGRLVAITGASQSPDNPAFRDEFRALQDKEGHGARIVFTAPIDGRLYAKHTGYGVGGLGGRLFSARRRLSRAMRASLR